MRAQIALRIALLFSAVMSCAASRAQASDSTIPCDSPPEKGARVAVHPGTQVTTTKDVPSQTCTFSINGAVATSPPAREVLQALNFFRTPNIEFVDPKRGQQRAAALAALLSAPSPVNEVSKELQQQLFKADQVISVCLKDFFSEKLPDMVSEDKRISCRAYARYTDAKTKSELLATRLPAVAVPTLAISVNWENGRFISTAYLPITITQLAPVPLP